MKHQRTRKVLGRQVARAAVAVLLLAGVPVLQAQEIDFGPTLERDALIEAVLQRNPSIESARQGWLAAQQLYPQATALADPMLMTSIAPLSIAGSMMPFGYMAQASQMLPYPGKREVMGAMARAEAEAMRGDYEDVRLELAAMASMLYDEYYFAERALEINEHHLALIADLKKSAEVQYVVGRASQQDPIRAEVELAELRKMNIELVNSREEAGARINTLLHRDPQAPLPPSPASQTLAPAVKWTSADLQQIAVGAVPMLEAAKARIDEREAALKMARLEFYPDFSVAAGYTSMEGNDHRFTVGVSINLPVQRERREAAVREARARLEQARQAESSLQSEVRLQVDRALREVKKAREIALIYLDHIVPAAGDQLAAARGGFESGTNDFMAVIMAENKLRGAGLEYQMALAELNMKLAGLDRAMGRMPSAGPRTQLVEEAQKTSKTDDVAIAPRGEE